MKIIMAIGSAVLAVFGAIVFINVKDSGSSALWIALACNSISGFGFSYAFTKQSSLKNLYAVFLAAFFCMLDFLALAFGGCSRLL